MKRLPARRRGSPASPRRFAQTPFQPDIYMYQGADRDKRLGEGAKKERQVGALTAP